MLHGRDSTKPAEDPGEVLVCSYGCALGERHIFGTGYAATNLNSRHWATLGALVTVGAVAFDPFLQAVISTHGQLDNILAGANATIGQSLRIDSGMVKGLVGAAIRDEATGLVYLAGSSSKADFGFISSVWNGFQNTSTFRNDAIGT